MTPERWATIEAVFNKVAEAAEPQRSALLDRECAGDPELRREVEALLRQGDKTEGSFRRAFLQGAQEAMTTPPIASPPKRSRLSLLLMFVLVPSFLVVSIFILYLIVFGPVQLEGIHATFEGGGGMLIQNLESGQAVAASGLRSGDRVISIDDRAIRNASDWTSSTGTLEVGRQHQWIVERAGERITLTITPKRATFSGRIFEGYQIYLGHLLTGMILGLLIAWKRPGDPVASIGAWFLMSASIAYGFPHGWAALWRHMPVAVQIPLWITQVSRFVLEGIFLSFFLMFPRRLFASRWPWLVIWLPVVATLPWRIAAYDRIIHPREGAALPAWILQAGFIRTFVYLLVGIGVLIISYYRRYGLDERRRMRVLVFGTALSAASTAAVVLIDSFWGRTQSFQFGLMMTFVFPFNTAAFFSMAYAILRHRVMDLRVILRQGLQYAFARGFVLALIPAIGTLFVVDLTINSQETLARIMQSRGWIYFALAGIAYGIHWKRAVWLGAIDRQFFRESYDAHRVLREVILEIRSARNLEDVASRVVTQIDTAFHAEFVSIMTQEPDQPEFHILSVAPGSVGTAAPSRLPSESKLVALACLLGRPIAVLTSDSSWLEKRLPAGEIDLFRQQRIDLVVPIEALPQARQALLILGLRKSEQPYTADDQELLQTIASSLSLLLVPAAAAVQRQTVFNECPQCGRCYDSGASACSHEGVRLTPVYLPRVLAGRYRMDRRRGQGGMGTVYEALDNSLDRRVAVKVIREELLGSADAAERFQREARASAAFAHPNVVTIHDFGVEGSRAFLVMELLEGVTLREELAGATKLEPQRVHRIMRETCAALDAAHRRQMIHRDVKPENLFLTSVGTKVLDFGIAKFLRSNSDDAATLITAQTRTGFVVGTPAYMSPEQLLGEAAEVSWDLWALAVVAYETLTGKLPFPGSSQNEWRRAILNGEFAPTERWDTFFKQAFAPDRAIRPKSAAEFVQSLESVL